MQQITNTLFLCAFLLCSVLIVWQVMDLDAQSKYKDARLQIPSFEDARLQLPSTHCVRSHDVPDPPQISHQPPFFTTCVLTGFPTG